LQIKPLVLLLIVVYAVVVTWLWRDQKRIRDCFEEVWVVDSGYLPDNPIRVECRHLIKVKYFRQGSVPEE